MDKNSLIVRKATWLVQQKYPFVTTDDVAQFAEDIQYTLDDDDRGKIQLCAQDIADFACDVIGDL